MAQTVYAKFASAKQCEQAAGALLDFGVRAEDIALVARETDPALASDAIRPSAYRAIPQQSGYRGGSARVSSVIDRPAIDVQPAAEGDDGRDFTPEAGAGGVEAVTSKGYVVSGNGTVETIDDGNGGMDEVAKDGITVTTAADAAAGAATGAGWGLGLGILAGLACLAIPGVGLVFGGGALATALGGALGATVAGAAAGGVVGYLKDQGMPDHVAVDYDSALRDGGALLAVMTPSNHVDSIDAEAVLNKYGAVRTDVYNR